MIYIPLYRKWRSQNFDEIVGQEFIVQTLRNAIKNGRVAHAYLFSGPRGTGKTSTARIFAKALNCSKGPTPDPCGSCGNCVKITSGHAVDVIEIDAASNRGIDEIRDLREKVKYMPVEGRYKVYIIDEAHMLTSEACNALLKTLEEPPLHAIFVLATTEPQKMPVTILSRCQRLDFRRLSNPELLAQLKKIAAKESIKIDDDAASLIARNSDGSMRDAISLFDQLISLCGGTINHDDVIAVLGTANSDLIFDFGEAFSKANIAGLFDLINKLVAEGRSVTQVTKDVVMHFRNLMLVVLGNESVVEESIEHIKKLKEQAKSFNMERLKGIIRVLSKAEVDMKWHPQARLLLEVAIMEACTDNVAVNNEIAAEANRPVKKEDIPEVKQPARAENFIKKGRIDSLSDIRQNWNEILGGVKKKNVFAFISLHEGEPYSLEGGILLIKFKPGFAFHKGRLEEAATKKAVEDTLREISGKEIRIECIIDKEVSKPEASASMVADIFGGQVIS